VQSAQEARQVGNGLIVWQLDLFVGSAKGTYTSKRFAGTLPVRLPVGESDELDPVPVDSSALLQFKLRGDLGVMELTE
jgi:hypothetical protein